MTNQMTQKVSDINQLITALGYEFNYGLFELDQSSDRILQKRYDFIEDATKIIRQLSPDEAATLFGDIKKKMFKHLQKQIDACNADIAEAYLRCRYGVFVLDSQSETINYRQHGIECFYDIPEGVKKINKVQYEVETIKTIHRAAENIFFGIIEAKEKESYVTKRFEFVGYEDSDTTIRGVCAKPEDWSKFTIEIHQQDFDGKWRRIFIAPNISSSFESIERAIRQTLKIMRLREKPSIFSGIADALKGDDHQ